MQKWTICLIIYGIFFLSAISGQGQIVSFDRMDNLPEGVTEVNTIVQDKESVIWMATNKGLLKQQGDSLVGIYDESRPLVYAINSIYVDDDNVKWLGTYTSSVVRFRDTSDIKVISFLEHTNNEYELITGVAKHDNVLWATTASGKLFSYDFEEEEIKEHNGPRCKSIYDMRIYHKNGRLWLATSSGMYEEKFLWGWSKVQYFKAAYGIYRNNDEYWAVGQSKDNRTLLIIHLNYYLSIAGLIDIPQYQWKDMILEGLGDPFIRFNDVDFDRDGKIWFATDDGIIRYNPEVGYAFPIRNDKYDDFNIDEVRNILVEKRNRIWVSSFGNVIYRIDFR